MNVCRMDDIAHIQGGLQVTRKRAGLPIEVPYLRVANVYRDTLALAEIKTINVTRAELDRTRLERGDILVVEGHGNRSELGRAAIWDGSITDCVHQNHLIRVRIDRTRGLPEYVARFLNSTKGRAQLLRMGKTTSGLNTISKSQVADIEVPLPRLPEQRHIAAILDEADALRRKRREALGLLDELLRSAFLEMFGDPVTNPRGWPVVALGRMAEVQGGLQVTSKRASLPIEVPYLRVANVYRDRIDLSAVKTIQATEAEVRRVRLSKGDVLIVEGHGNPDELGRCAVWAEEGEMVHQNHLIRVRPNADRLRPAYLSAFVNSDGGRRQMLRAGKTTSGLNTISTGNVKATRILLPPIDVQRRWESFVATHRDQVAARHRQGDEADHLFHALLHRAFTGGGEPHHAT